MTHFLAQLADQPIRRLSVFFVCLQFCLGTLVAVSPKSINPSQNEWKAHTVLTSTERKPARTAVLIMVPPVATQRLVENRRNLDKKMWEQHMNSQPAVDCFFVENADLALDRHPADEIWIEGNTMFVANPPPSRFASHSPLHKVIAAIEFLLPNYTHFVRTNLNAFFDLKQMNDYMETHHQSFYTTPLCQEGSNPVSHAFFCTAAVAAHIVSEYRRLEAAEEQLIHSCRADGAVMTALATGVFPKSGNHPFRCCPSLPQKVRQHMDSASLTTNRFTQYGITLTPSIGLEKSIQFCEKIPSTVMFYQMQGDFNLTELARLYQHLLHKHYMELSFDNLIDFAEHTASY